MDICDFTEKKVTIKCKNHKVYSPSFILLNSHNEEDVLLCSQCIEQEEMFGEQGFKEFQQIEPILMSDKKTILPKWPPLNNQRLLRQINQQLKHNGNQVKKQEDIVTTFFDRISQEVVKHIEEIKKETLQKCCILPELEEQLSKEYNQIAEKERLIEILMAPNTTYEIANSKLKEMIQLKQQQKQQNEESLTNLFNSYLNNLKQFDETTPTEQLNQVIKLIKSINFFPKLELENQDQAQLNQSSLVDEIIKMIENKTNYCTSEFIVEANTKLKQWSFIFKDFQPTQIYLEGHEEPLSFEGITNEEFQKLEILIETIKDKEKDIDLTPQIRLITDWITSPANYLTKEFSENISLTMKQLTPFFDGFELNKMNLENKTHINFRKITVDQVELIQKLVSKMSELTYEINPNSIDKQQLPCSHKILEKVEKQTFSSYQLNLLLQQYPICELSNQKLSFIKGYYSNSQTNIALQNIDDFQVKFTKIKDSAWTNIMSNWYLEKNKTYQIVFEINYQNQSYFHYSIGLTSNEKNSYIQNDKLSFYTHHGGLYTGYGMDKVKKGSKDNLKLQKQLQLSVNLSKSILEIGDYPNLNNVMEVNEDKKARLQEDTLYQVVFSFFQINDEISIKSIQEINE